MFFDGWSGLGRVAIVGLMAYAGLVVLLRISGKRTLSKMNAFDLVVTVALGSTLATILLSNDVALAEGMLAFALLIGMQFVITWASVRSATVRQLVKAEPSLLLHRGRMLDGAMRQERVTEAEVLAAVRAQGMVSLEHVEAVILETDGSFTVVGRPSDAPPSALRSVSGHARASAQVGDQSATIPNRPET
jgi:uncharacterized membrane protein YcaP (DUF421 family)